MHAAALLLSLFSASVVNAHFGLSHPKPLGSSAANQDDGPCGGYSVNENTPVTDFYVDGESVAYSSSHPQVKVLYRVVEGTKADGDDLDWSPIHPIIEQNGAGDFCLPVTAPRSYVGKRGILQVIQTAVDGRLYACALVSFRDGSRPSSQSVECANGTGVDAQYSSDDFLQSLLDDDDDDSDDNDDTPNQSGTTSAPSATDTPAPSETPSSANLHRSSIVAALTGVLAAVVLNMAL